MAYGGGDFEEVGDVGSRVVRRHITCWGRETGPVVVGYGHERGRLRLNEERARTARWLSTLRVEAVEKRLSKRSVFKNTEPLLSVLHQ